MWLNGMFRNDSDLASQSTSNLECQPLDSGYFHSIHTLLPRNLFLIWPRIVIIADYYTLKTHQHLYPKPDTNKTLFGLPCLTVVKISFDSESEVTVNENIESGLKKNMNYFQPSSPNSYPGTTWQVVYGNQHHWSNGQRWIISLCSGRLVLPILLVFWMGRTMIIQILLRFKPRLPHWWLNSIFTTVKYFWWF